MSFVAQSNPENYWSPVEVTAIINRARVLFGDETYLFFKLLFLSGRREGEVLGTPPNRAKSYEAGKPYSVNEDAKKHKKHSKKFYRQKIMDGLKVGDINFEGCKVSFRIEKKASPITKSFKLPPAFLMELRNWLETSGRLVDRDGKVFRFCEKTAWNRLKRSVESAFYVDAQGASHPVKFGSVGNKRFHSVHTLRHSFADMAVKRINIASLKYRMQHSNADVTLSYTHPDESDADVLYDGLA